MEFDPNFRGKLSFFFHENPSLNPQIPPMFSSQSSVLIPPPQSNPLMSHSNNSHHFEDHNLNPNVPNHNPALMMEPPSSITNPFYDFSTLSLGEVVTVTPNNNKMDVLHGNHDGGIIWDFSQQTEIDQSLGSYSFHSQHPSQSPPSLSANEYVLLRVGFGEERTIITENDHDHIRDESDHDDDQIDENVQNDSNTANIIKGQWSPSEDKALVNLVKQHGEKKWALIARSINRRIGKQCRERWHNHLRPNIRVASPSMKDSWTPEEDMILIKTHQEVGNKWAEIAKRMPGRSENTIKNHWNATKRRQTFNRQNKKPDTCEGSLLRAYIKNVTEAEEVAEYKMKKSISNVEMKMLRGCDEHLSHIFLEINQLNDEGYGHEVKKQHHMINGNDGYGPMLHAITSGSVNIDFGAMVKRLGLEDEKKGEMDMIKVVTAKF